MTANKKILSQLELLEAMADGLKEECYKLRESLGVVSTTPTARKGKYSASLAKVMAKREKLINKRA